MKYLLALIAVVGLLAVGCGGGDDLGASPDTRGMALPQAEKTLKRAGYQTTTTDDGLFGVVIESHWVVCEQEELNTRMVRLDVSKECES